MYISVTQRSLIRSLTLYFLVNLIEFLKEFHTLNLILKLRSGRMCMHAGYGFGDTGPRFPCGWSWEPGNEATLYTVLSLVNSPPKTSNISVEVKVQKQAATF